MPSWSLNHESPSVGEDSVGFPAGADIACYGTQVDLYVFRHNMRREISDMKDKSKEDLDRLNGMIDDVTAGQLELVHHHEDLRNHFYSLQAHNLSLDADFAAFKRKVMRIFKSMVVGGVVSASVVGYHFFFR